MMRCSPFRLHAPRSVGEATRLLAEAGPEAVLLGGGTDLVPNLKRRQTGAKVLVSTRRLPELHKRAPGLLGGGITLAEIASDPAMHVRYRALARAAAQVATPQIRNMGTLAGNLCIDTRCNYYTQSYEWRQAIDFCMKAPGPQGVAIAERAEGICWVAPGSPRCWAVSSTDCAPALLALGAQVTLAGAEGERTIPLDLLYANDGMRHLTKRPGELITTVHLPDPEGVRSTYWKLRRRGSFDFPVLSVAGAVRLGAGGIVEEACLVLGAVASRPVQVEAARQLVGERLSDERIAAVAEQAARLAKPLDNTDFALGWRKRVAQRYVEGVLKELRGDDPAALGLLAHRAAAGVLPVLG